MAIRGGGLPPTGPRAGETGIDECNPHPSGRRLLPPSQQMNLNRNTEQFSALCYLDWIQRGGTEDWKRLYQLCKDPAVAMQVAAVLPLRDPDLLPSALLWKLLLEDLHPSLNLSIDLRPEALDIGV